MKDKKIIILILAAGFLLLVLFMLILFLPKKKSSQSPGQSTTTTKQKATAESFAESFTKEFATYSYANTSDYMTRLTPFISPTYLPTFKKKYALPKDNQIAPQEKDNFSKYQSSTAIYTLNKAGSKTTVYVGYTALKLDAPVKPKQFTDQNAITVVVDSVNGKPQITSFSFATTE